ncbi:hypothetical protein [Indioceanicola profundi]|uniref:hypothetical protein n=1 Tax=Indioceanicola profundi TaxID=2220096 RepID=UPI000E6AA16C|nr:hypothetical protein [Indioceanicola profundi]
MSARAQIGIENEDGSVTYVYCNLEGNPARLGKVLEEAWSNRTALGKLLAMGCLARIGPDLGVAHPPLHHAYPGIREWMGRYGDMCEFYHRDWYDGWSRQDGPWTADSIEAFASGMSNKAEIGASYVLRRTGQWHFIRKAAAGARESVPVDMLKPLAPAALNVNTGPAVSAGT